MVSDKNEAKDLELKKHVGSIHCSNTLSLLQRKISNVLLYHAYDELMRKDEHEIAIKTLCNLVGYYSHDYETLKRALKALISTVLEWNLLGDSKGNEESESDWNASSILASVGIKGGICKYSYSHRLKKLLYMPEVYGRINITVQAQFKSNYALALYENCVRYQNLSFTRWFPFITFRKLMGVPENKYPIFRDFKRRVLDKSVTEVNLYSDIIVTPEIEKEGHKITRIRFKLSPREKNKDKFIPSNLVNPEQKLLDKLIVKFGLDLAQAKKMIKNYGSQFIEDKIILIESSSTYKKDKVKNYAAYLKSALKEDYGNNQLNIIQASAVKIKQEMKTHKLVEQTKNLEKLRKEFSEYISNQVDKRYNQLNSTQQENMVKEFEEHLKNSNNHFVLDKFLGKNLEDRIVRSVFRNFLRENYNHLFCDLISFAAFQQINAVNIKQTHYEKTSKDVN